MESVSDDDGHCRRDSSDPATLARDPGAPDRTLVLRDPLFWNAFKIIVLFTLTAVPIKVALAFLLALVLNSPRMPWRSFFRTVYFLPVVTTTAIVGVVMQFVFDPTSGPVNRVLVKLGLFIFVLGLFQLIGIRAAQKARQQ